MSDQEPADESAIRDMGTEDLNQLEPTVSKQGDHAPPSYHSEDKDDGDSVLTSKADVEDVQSRTLIGVAEGTASLVASDEHEPEKDTEKQQAMVSNMIPLQDR